MNDNIPVIKDYVADRLRAWDVFSDVPILTDSQEDLRGQIDRALFEEKTASGKVGVFGLVVVSTATDPAPNSHGSLDYMVEVQFHENPVVNRLATQNETGFRGTDKMAEELAREAWTILKHWHVEGIMQLIPPAQGPLGPFMSPFAPWGFKMQLIARELRQHISGKVAKVSVSIEAGSATLTCGTSAAAIYYTLDGTYPSASKTLYSAPFAVTSGQTLLACGYKSNYIPSDLSRNIIP